MEKTEVIDPSLKCCEITALEIFPTFRFAISIKLGNKITVIYIPTSDELVILDSMMESILTTAIADNPFIQLKAETEKNEFRVFGDGNEIAPKRGRCFLYLRNINIKSRGRYWA